jgi:hypothetical protein
MAGQVHNFFSPSRATRLAEFGQHKRTQIGSDARSQENIRFLWEKTNVGGELRVNASNRLYLLPKAEGFFWIFQLIANVFKRICVDKWLESTDGYRTRTIGVLNIVVKNVFYTHVLQRQNLNLLTEFYGKVSRGVMTSGMIDVFATTEPAKFLLLMEELGKNNLISWEKEPPQTIPSDVTVVWPSLIHTYIFKPNSDLRDFWVRDGNGPFDNLYPRAQ